MLKLKNASCRVCNIHYIKLSTMDLVLVGPVGGSPDGVGPAELVEHQSSLVGCTSIILFFSVFYIFVHKVYSIVEK